MDMGLDSLSSEPVELSRSARLSRALLDSSGSHLLFQRVRQPDQAKTLPGLAGDQYSARQGWQRRAHRGAAGAERRWSSFGWRGRLFGISAGIDAGARESIAC